MFLLPFFSIFFLPCVSAELFFLRRLLTNFFHLNSSNSLFKLKILSSSLVVVVYCRRESFAIDREKKNAKDILGNVTSERFRRREFNERLRQKLFVFKKLCFGFPREIHSREIELVSERFSDLNSRSLALSLESARARKNNRIERTNERTKTRR